MDGFSIYVFLHRTPSGRNIMFKMKLTAVRCGTSGNHFWFGFIFCFIDLNSVKLMNLKMRQSTGERTGAEFFIQKKAKHASACTGFTAALRKVAALNSI